MTGALKKDSLWFIIDLTTNQNKGVHKHMLHLKDIKNKLPNEVKALFSELKMILFLHQAGIQKKKGYSASVILPLFSV